MVSCYAPTCFKHRSFTASPWTFPGRTSWWLARSVGKERPRRTPAKSARCRYATTSSCWTSSEAELALRKQETKTKTSLGWNQTSDLRDELRLQGMRIRWSNSWICVPETMCEREKKGCWAWIMRFLALAWDCQTRDFISCTSQSNHQNMFGLSKRPPSFVNCWDIRALFPVRDSTVRHLLFPDLGLLKEPPNNPKIHIYICLISLQFIELYDFNPIHDIYRHLYTLTDPFYFL